MIGSRESVEGYYNKFEESRGEACGHMSSQNVAVESVHRYIEQRPVDKMEDIMHDLVCEIAKVSNKNIVESNLACCGP
jgi:hypothetical protein